MLGSQVYRGSLSVGWGLDQVQEFSGDVRVKGFANGQDIMIGQGTRHLEHNKGING